MVKKKPSPVVGICMDPKTGKFDEVYNIAKSELDRIIGDLNAMRSLLVRCSAWEHSKKLDRDISVFLKREKAR